MKFTSTICLFGLVLVGCGALAQVEDPDPIVDYYWQKARRTALSHDPNVDGIQYRLTTRTFRHRIMNNGSISATDTVVQTLYFSDGSLDSAIVAGNEENDQTIPDLGYPAIFDMDLDPNLFPNDTGGVDLAIGFLTDTTRLDQPDGLAVIDRYRYNLRTLYLCYPHLDDFRRFSRCFRFVMVDDYLFPDSVWEVATVLGIFSSESYRLETGITDIQVQRTTESVDP